MAKYRYIITDPRGKEKKGVVEADKEEFAVERLQSEGNVVLSIKKSNAMEDQSWNIQIGSGVKTKDICIFCRQFASILEAGVTVIDGLRMIQSQTENNFLAKALANVQTNVEKGESLAAAMEMENKVFPSLLINMVTAGEATGNLEIAFQRIASQFEKDLKLNSIVKQAMIYPVMVLIIATIVVIVLMINVVPTFQTALESMGSELPGPTKFVIGLSDFMVNNIILVIGSLIALVVTIIIAKGSESGKKFTSMMALKIPMFRNLSVKSAAAKFSMTMSTLIVAGVPLVEALGVVSKIIENRIIRQSLLDAREEVLQGVPLSEPLEEADLFPPMVYHMVKIGEETGSTEKMLDRIADYYEEEVTNATKALTTMMEPLILLVLAVVVGGVVMAIVMPMMSIYQQAG